MYFFEPNNLIYTPGQSEILIENFASCPGITSLQLGAATCLVPFQQRHRFFILSASVVSTSLDNISAHLNLPRL